MAKTENQEELDLIINNIKYNDKRISSILDEIFYFFTEIEKKEENNYLNSVVDNEYKLSLFPRRSILNGRQLTNCYVFIYFLVTFNTLKNNDFKEIEIKNFFLNKYKQEIEILIEKSKKNFIISEIEENKEDFEKEKIELIKNSLTTYDFITKKISLNIRNEIFEETIKFLNERKDVSSFLDSRFSEKERNEKLIELLSTIEKIFEDFQNEKLLEKKELDFNKERIEFSNYFLIIIQDVYTVITVFLFLKNLKPSNSLYSFEEKKWFLFFYSTVLDNFKNKGKNLLKVSENKDFINYGAKTSLITKSVDSNFFFRNREKEGNEIENKAKIFQKMITTSCELFYILLSFGYIEKSNFVFPNKSSSPRKKIEESNQKNIIIEINSYDNNEKLVKFPIEKITKNYFLEKFVDKLYYISEQETNIRSNLDNIVIRYNNKIEEILDRDPDNPNTFNIVELMNNLFEEINICDFLEEDKKIFLSQYIIETNFNKKNMIKEFFNLIIEKNPEFNKSLLETFNEKLKQVIKKELEGTKIKIIKNYNFLLKDNVFFRNNFYSSEIENAFKRLEELDKIESLERIKVFFDDIDFSEMESIYKNENKEITLKLLKQEIRKKVEYKYRNSLIIDSGILFSSEDDYTNKDFERKNILKKEVLINLKIFISIFVFKKIEKDKILEKLKEKLKIKDLTEKEKKIFFEIICDIIFLQVIKENKTLNIMFNLKESDYLEYFSDTEELFQKLIEGFEISEEDLLQKRKMDIFEEAIKTGFEFYNFQDEIELRIEKDEEENPENEKYDPKKEGAMKKIEDMYLKIEIDKVLYDFIE